MQLHWFHAAKPTPDGNSSLSIQHPTLETGGATSEKMN